jgi:uncharacterized membrane protein YoaK (UPF0700 family)
MLVTQGDARNHAINRRLGCALAAIAGSVNCAAFQAVGFFSANMTGNVSILSDRIALGSFAPALFYLAIIIVFVIGAFLSTLLISAGHRRDAKAIYAVSILIEGLLMALLGSMEVALPAEHPTSVLVLGSSFLMGWQNAVVTRISGARVRTTHVSGMVTDIGIELGLSLDAALGRRIAEEPRATRAGLNLHCWTVAAFLLGGAAGVLIYQAVQGYLFIIAASLLLAMSIDALRRTRQSV